MTSTATTARPSAALRWFGRVRSAATLAAAAGVIWLMLPPALGGRTGYVIVAGHSMEPTYHTNDLAITYETSRVEVGDVIVYRVPQGEQGAGAHVIHRVVGGDGVSGYVTQGDNREGPDTWHPDHGDVVGKVVALVPQGGRALAMAFNLGNLGLVALAFLAWALWPRPDERLRETQGVPGDHPEQAIA